MKRRIIAGVSTATVIWALGCGSRSESLDTTRDAHGSSAAARPEADDTPRHDNASNANSDTTKERDTSDTGREGTGRGDGVADDGAPRRAPDADDERANDDVSDTERANDQRITELEERPSFDPAEIDDLLPQCATPAAAELGYPTYGTEAVRLHWKPETGECRFTSGDGTPDGWSPILSFRRHGEDTFLSTLGDWRYLAPSDLDLDDLPPGRTLTFYPYLDEWQFVVDLRYEGQQVTIERFHYIEGAPPKNYGVPDRTSNDPVPSSMLVPCSSLNGAPGEDDTTAGSTIAGDSSRTPVDGVSPAEVPLESALPASPAGVVP